MYIENQRVNLLKEEFRTVDDLGIKITLSSTLGTIKSHSWEYSVRHLQNAIVDDPRIPPL